MARAGYCDLCATNVWLTPDGTCPRGHSAEHISRVYEVPAPGEAVARPPATTPYAAPPSTGIGAVGSDASAPITTSPEKKSRKGLVIAIVAIVAALLLCCCGVLFAIAIPAFSGSQKSSQEKTCFSNERMIEGAAQTSIADHDGVSPTSLAELVPDYLQAVPRCPAGGNYSFDTGDGTVTCSVHGHF